MSFDSFESSALTLMITLTLIIVLHALMTTNKVYDNDVYALNKIKSADFNFAAVGDWGCNSDTKNTINNIIHKDPELVLSLGDFAYQDKADCWFKFTDPINERLKITLGNHDHLSYTTEGGIYLAPERMQQYITHFNLSRQYYSFNYQNVHFIAISTEIPYEAGSKQYYFVKRDLQKSASDPDINWIVVFYHRLAYTSPALVDSIPILRDTYHPLFQKYGVDLVMQAHSHNYQRTYPIQFNRDDSLNPIITDKNTANYYNPKGQIFTITGTAGAPDIHNFTGPAAPYTAVQFNAYGFLDINVIHNGTVIEGNFYENNGTVKDHFTIEKPKKDNKQNESSSPSTSTSLSLEPTLNNAYKNKFRVETVVKGLRWPTDFVFLGPDDILVSEKNNGTVQRVINGHILGQPLLDVKVANKIERGLLGIAISNATDNTTNVFLYYTESKRDGNDICPKSTYCIPGTEPIGNRLYKYDLTKNGTKLVNPKLLLDLPATPGPGHNGGKMIIGPNKNILIIVGDVMADGSRTQNYKDGKEPTGTGGILKVDPDGNSSNEGILGNKYPLNLYYAYGIRNGFGLDFDPVTGNLWDTENGPDFGDEINLVKPGFNSGWKDVQGIWNHKGGKEEKGTINLDGLDDFNGKGKYSTPEFTWNDTVGPTGIKFFNSDKMGTEFNNSLFVGDVYTGNLYHFNLNDNRTALLLNGTLRDRVADSPQELEKIIFAEGFGGITDLEVGPDGYLYVLSIFNGAIYKIVPI
jgi:glucose/arabinose dehydrogenase